ncbi:hypothetical protein [Streptosporangium sp. CA-115845]|uniref:hypothetical protein n=1 Tax=Streptosporangium sp. CA-115845 TaxID=3240071 RepID=UPI003D92B6CC
MGLVVALSAGGCQQVGEGLSQIERDRYQLSLLPLNIAGTQDEVWGIKVPWRDRYARVATWLKDSKTAPDLFLLQEMYARKFFWPASLRPHDHEGLHYLIKIVDDATGGSYRIGYLATRGTQMGINHLTSGVALIYNSKRLRNITRAPAAQLQPAEGAPTILGFHARKSWPCTDPHPEYADSCSLLDGEGVFYTSSFKGDDGRNNFEAAGARLVFVEDPAAHFDVFNVHLHPRSGTDYLQSPTYIATRDLIGNLTAVSGERDRPVYPPILAGDFNGGTEAFSNFVVSRADGVDAVATGTHEAAYRLETSQSDALPGGEPREPGFCAPRDRIWSDHCAIFVQFHPVRVATTPSS